MEQDHFFHLLQELTVDCKDDQTAFVVQDRILILKKLLEFQKQLQLFHEIFKQIIVLHKYLIYLLIYKIHL